MYVFIIFQLFSNKKEIHSWIYHIFENKMCISMYQSKKSAVCMCCTSVRGTVQIICLLVGVVQQFIPLTVSVSSTVLGIICLEFVFDLCKMKLSACFFGLCVFLQMNDNQIDNWSDLDELKNAKSLETVYLERNPLQKDPQYRRKIMLALPSVRQIDATFIRF